LKPSARVWTLFTVLKLVPLVLLVAAFVLAFDVDAASPRVAAVATSPGAGEWLRAMLVVVFTLQGFEVVPVVAHHAKNFARSVPLATLGALGVAAVLYLFVHAACAVAVPDLPARSAPLIDAGTELGGTGLARLVGIGTNISAAGIAFGMFAITPRYLAVLGRAAALHPKLGRENRRAVPVLALWISVAVVEVLVVLGKLGELFALSSLAVMVQYSASALALGKLAWRREHGLGRGALVVVLLAAGAIAMLVTAATRGELLTLAAVLAVGWVLPKLPSTARERPVD
jgi:amino acid transporter